MKPNRSSVDARLAIAACAAVVAQVAAHAAVDRPVCATAAPSESLLQVNLARAGDCGDGARAARELAWNAALEAAAVRHVRWLAATDAFAHTGPLGETVVDRARDAGYRYARLSENLAHGQADVAAAVAAWIASPGHCANLRDADVSEMALACAPGVDGRPLWVLVLGRPA